LFEKERPMRKTIIITVVLCLVAAFAYAQAPASSASTAAPSGASGAPMKHSSSMGHMSYHGTVASVDAAGKSFVVHPMKGADMTIKVNDKTQYFPKGKTWDDVKADAKVHGKYKADGADMWAVTVDFASAKAAAAPAAKPN
jgi:hypothetical protein